MCVCVCVSLHFLKSKIFFAFCLQIPPLRSLFSAQGTVSCIIVRHLCFILLIYLGYSFTFLILALLLSFCLPPPASHTPADVSIHVGSIRRGDQRKLEQAGGSPALLSIFTSYTLHFLSTSALAQAPASPPAVSTKYKIKYSVMTRFQKTVGEYCRGANQINRATMTLRKLQTVPELKQQSEE